jgi:hypothetical protein
MGLFSYSGSFRILVLVYILRIVAWDLSWAGRQPNYTVLLGNFNTFLSKGSMSIQLCMFC